ncbi:hypothetical protein A9Q86_00445 [Flavobacteriales bacterium 33_180_T64]|nr:hypothetical protein A9Q86_00445 [Flavobacteriales bacterium 33_180_T64]
MKGSIKYLFIISLLIWSSQLIAQSKNITGRVIASGDVIGIHIINKTASKFAITDDNGQFEIPAKLNDTIMVSGLQYKLNEFVVNDIIMQSKEVTVNLEDEVNFLDEVVVGKVLTGDLMSDIENRDTKRQINFYNLGIPGYTGPKKTQSERRLYEAKSGSGLLPLNPVLNWISGRTNRLKAQIKREELDIAISEAMSKFSQMLFETEVLEVSKQKEFFYFSSDDPKFLHLSKIGDDMKLFQFLQEKLEAFKSQIEEH